MNSKQRIVELENAIEEIYTLIADNPAGCDEDASYEDTNPSDDYYWRAGLILKACEKVRKPIEERQGGE